MNLDADRKTITIVVALFLASYLFIFFIGYYVGKKNALDEFSENIKQDAFSDRVYASLFTFSEGQEQSVTEELQETASVAATAPDEVQDAIEGKLYSAVLVGFGAENSARKYRESLRSRGVPARIFERASKTARGNKRLWYQVVTEPAPLQQTQEWVHRVSLSDKLQGVVIKEQERLSNELPN